MVTMTEVTSDFISRAVGEVKKIKPDYRLLLDLYEKIFIEQENSKQSIHLSGFPIPDEALSLKRTEQFPLCDRSQFSIDTRSAATLFGRLCAILGAADGEVSEAVKKIDAAIESKRLLPGNLFAPFLGEDEQFFKKLEDEFSIDRRILGFLIYNSIKPSLVLFSETISKYLVTDQDWDRGYCPVCGSMPELSVFGDNGKRSLLCGFCGHQWPSKRVSCFFCENTDHQTIRYYEIEDEEEYRVDVCDRCKKYIKTVDTQKTTRALYLPLESISTPYIDLKFKEMGFIPGNMPVDQQG